jgi:uncharacterized membrane protein YbhN (UPF0104 family)
VRYRWWVGLLGLLVVLLALRFVVHFPWLRTWQALADADWALLAAAAGWNLLSLVAKAWAWQRLLRPTTRARFLSAQAATFAGAAINSIGVAVSGEAARVHVMWRRDGVPAAAVARSVAASRVVEGAALGVCLIGAAFAATGVTGWRVALAGALLLLGATVALHRLPWLRVGDRPTLALPIAINAGSWMAQWGAYHCAIIAAGASVSPGRSALALVLSNLGGILRLTPANLGVVQGAIVLAVTPAGVPVATAVAAGLALQAVQVLPVLAIGLGLLGGRGVVALSRRREPEAA